MPTYVYGCENKEHKDRIVLNHRILDDPYMECAECHMKLVRIPQPFQWGVGPFQTQLEWNIRNYRHKLRNEPREIMYDQVSTDRGKPQKDFSYRR